MPEARSPHHKPFQSPEGLVGGSRSKAGSGESNTQPLFKCKAPKYTLNLNVPIKSGLTVKVKGYAF